MSFYHLLRPLLFRLEPERAHQLVMTGLTVVESVLARRPRAPRAWTHPMLEQRLWDLTFPTPVGLAAGFDKDARAAHVWSLLGFGFAELGTLTAIGQSGNPPPRIFRFPSDHALINRMGFNNAGAEVVAARLRARGRWCLPSIPIGINLGKSRVTPLAEAADDYSRSLRALFPFASYLVINVSSPNTPGLRELQDEANLAPLLTAVAAANRQAAHDHGQPPRPLLLKLSPDLADDALPGIVAAARGAGIAGLIATNTTTRRDGLTSPTAETGGLSGAPLRCRATAVIRTLHQLAGPALPIIGVGGIFSAADAYEKITAGASLVQVYTGLIYEGPMLARRVARELVSILRRNGFTHLRDAVGRDA